MPDSSSSSSTGVAQSQTDGSIPATNTAKHGVAGNGKDAPEPARDKEIKTPPKCRTPDPSGDEITTIFFLNSAVRHLRGGRPSALHTAR